ncbi:MAG: [FeFe] hydrogenase H-cluster radical SAM maturase HydE [Geothrix sp.]|uniref:[FeFe] hydrogenase H-cluster radical SAM maturase HydE n=1 Tax=Geothrix sp. TaxID=1962974 RepID=UPI0017EF4695|nr:[FeFe] hydrogenase H-cluster radical SAM maturase HydE [Geothrix sp.]NWJ42084.1 [FeFe] hydrogenase H-cluster radical SAM maturase HydE [Geothrix sp.]WIL19948.1 MAG: [FeFe] hydrogenase H-cluster radical SAM maturase HydE [Geothrix sp.]
MPSSPEPGRFRLDHAGLRDWLLELDPERLQALWSEADRVRRAHVGDAVHLRGLVEVSSHCVRHCLYCGLRAPSTGLDRYRMEAGEILACAHEAVRLGYGSVVLQGGEDPGLGQAFIAGVVRVIKQETPLAVTLSLGERSDEDLRAWKSAGADRYLLRFETSDPALYRRIHPDLPGIPSDRFAQLERMRDMGYEIGTGVMVGIPGQTWDTLAADILRFREYDMDMIGVGPFLPSPRTPLGGPAAETFLAAPEDQVPNDELTTLKAVALTRLVCPDANIPSTTALATLDRAQGRELGLMRGANVVMPNVTPLPFRALYEIYPGKACLGETPATCQGCLEGRLHALGRTIAKGPGGRIRTLCKDSVPCDFHH